VFEGKDDREKQDRTEEISPPVDSCYGKTQSMQALVQNDEHRGRTAQTTLQAMCRGDRGAELNPKWSLYRIATPKSATTSASHSISWFFSPRKSGARSRRKIETVWCPTAALAIEVSRNAAKVAEIVAQCHQSERAQEEPSPLVYCSFAFSEAFMNAQDRCSHQLGKQAKTPRSVCSGTGAETMNRCQTTP